MSQWGIVVMRSVSNRCEFALGTHIGGLKEIWYSRFKAGW